MAAGWVAVSALGGGAAHAATADSIPTAAGAHRFRTGADRRPPGRGTRRHQRLGEAAKPAHHSITVRHAATEQHRPASASRSTVDALDADRRLPASITEPLDKLKPVADGVVKPVTPAAAGRDETAALADSSADRPDYQDGH